MCKGREYMRNLCTSSEFGCGIYNCSKISLFKTKNSISTVE